MKSGSATFVAVVAAAIMVAQTTALTTFGGNKSPENNKTAPAIPPPVRGRECKSDSECSGITNTVCMTDPRDHKMRCLCVSKQAPVNGACPRYPRAMNSVCKADEECLTNAHCAVSNSTSNANTNARTCLCKEGFEEEDHMCNNGLLLAVPSIIALFTISFLPRGF